MNLPNERFDVAPNGVAAIPVQVVRKGYTGPIELTACRARLGWPAKATNKAGKNAGLVVLVLAKGDLPLGAYQFRIVGAATNDGKTAGSDGQPPRASVVQALEAGCPIRRCICKISSPWR